MTLFIPGINIRSQVYECLGSYLALVCSSTCASTDHLGSDLTSPLYMQINPYIISVHEEQMMFATGPLSMCFVLSIGEEGLCVCV